MKQRLHTILCVFAAFVLLFSASLFATTYKETASAAGTSIYLTPRNITLNTNGTFTVSLYTNTDSQVNAIQARLTFPSALRVESENASGSRFSRNLGADNPKGDGFYEVERSNPGGSITGNLFVTRITFRATAPGSHKIGFSNSRSYVINFPSGTNLVTSKTGGTYTVNNPPPPPQPTDVCPNIAGTQTSVPSGYTKNSSGNCVRQSTGGGGGGGGGGSRPVSRPVSIPTATIPKKESNASTSGLKISSFNISDFDYRTATVTWRTNKPATSKINFGTNYDDLSSEIKSDKKVTSHKIVIKGDYLRAGNHYFARITSDDGKAPVTLDAEFDTRAIVVLIKVNDPQGNPVADAQVYSGEVQGATNEKGEVSLEMAEGSMTIIAQKDNFAGEMTVDVVIPQDGGEVQQVIVPLAETVADAGGEAPGGRPILRYILVLFGFFALLIAGFLLWRRRQYAAYDNPLQIDTYTSPPPMTPPPSPPTNFEDEAPAAPTTANGNTPVHYPSLPELVKKDLDSTKSKKSTLDEEPTDMFSVLDEPLPKKKVLAEPKTKTLKTHSGDDLPKVQSAAEPSKSHHAKPPHHPEATIDEKDHSLKISHDS